MLSPSQRGGVYFSSRGGADFSHQRGGRPLVKASFIAKVHAVDAVEAVDAGLRDRHTEGFSPYMAFGKSEFNS